MYEYKNSATTVQQGKFGLIIAHIKSIIEDGMKS
jgi:hypothetical protein